MVARDEGIFAKHGLDADVSLIAINTTIPPAIVSNSIQIGGPTATVFLQAVDGGLDLVAVAGASVMDPVSAGAVAAVARNGVTIKDAKDFVGKKVGAPGIGAFLHVLFVKWLIEKGVDPKTVNFVEVTFPTQSDALKSGSVDAVLTGEPFITRIEERGNRRRCGSLPSGPQPHRSDPLLCVDARFRRTAPRGHQGLSQVDRGGSKNRQFRPRQGEQVDLQVHQDADRTRPT